jgi:hypothetical protein
MALSISRLEMSVGKAVLLLLLLGRLSSLQRIVEIEAVGELAFAELDQVADGELLRDEQQS